MGKVYTCDICRKPTNRIVWKLLLTDNANGSWSHTNYIAHADIGECCASKFNEQVRFHRRRKRKKPAAEPEAKVA